MVLTKDLVGEVLSGRYRLVGRIGGGGMGEVYRGHDLLLDRSVAVKILQPSLAADPELVARFKQEARAAARLTHPNVVAVHDWGCESELTYYMVMEYVAATDLRDLLTTGGALEPAQATEVVASLCDALDAAHSHGLVHRDVKPENILIARDGKVKVADFGIAVVADLERTSPGGAIVGTLRYLSPEQAGGSEATPASDIWAAGAVLREALTGRAPPAEAPAELLRRRAAEDAVAPSTLDADVPEELDAVVLRACARDPGDRYSSASDMALDLRRISLSLPPAPSVAASLTDVTGEVPPPGSDPTTTISPRTARRLRRLRARFARAALLAAILLALAYGGVRAGVTFFGPRDIRVPSLVGLPLEAAERRAGKEELLVEVVERRTHLKAPRGDVIAQAPRKGVLEEGSTVRVVVSAGLPSRPVPPVVGLDAAAARRRLRSVHFRVGEVTRRYSDDARGVVVAQEPEGGRLRWGSRVHLVVSRGPRPVEVPPVSGMGAQQAAGKLEGLGFVVVVIERHDDAVPAGKAVSTVPAAGASAPEGSEVQLIVSLGPNLRRFTMPDMRGKGVAEARRSLERMGLVIKVVQSCEGGRTVVDTDPIAGARVTEGDRAALFVC